MKDCECESCMNLPKSVQDENQKCQVDELRSRCKSIFPDWRVNVSYNCQNNKSRLYIIKKPVQTLQLDANQITKITSYGYFVTEIKVQLLGYHDYDIGHEFDNDSCQCDTCTGEESTKFTIVIYLEKNK